MWVSSVLTAEVVRAFQTDSGWDVQETRGGTWQQRAESYLPQPHGVLSFSSSLALGVYTLPWELGTSL